MQHEVVLNLQLGTCCILNLQFGQLLYFTRIHVKHRVNGRKGDTSMWVINNVC